MQRVATRVYQEVERQLPTVLKMSDAELKARAGQIPLSGKLYDGHVAFKEEDLVAAGDTFLAKDSGVREVVCTNKDEIKDTLDATNVSALVTLLLPVFGLPPLAIPLAVISLAVLIIKIGVNEYCKGFKTT
jgi:hypothetical protein